MNECSPQVLTFVPNEDGAAVAEYAAVAAVVALVIMGRVTDIDIVLDNVFTLIRGAIDFTIPVLSTVTRLLMSLLSMVL